jgi:phosphate acetyltransferase
MKTMAKVWERARNAGASVVLPEAGDERIMRAAAGAAQEGLARTHLVGPAEAIRKAAGRLKLDLREVGVVDPRESDRLDGYARYLHARREHKGMSAEEARELALQPLYFAALMVACGDADGVVAGAATTTADVVRSYILSIGVADGVTCVSSAFLMILADRNADETAYVFADASVVPDPDPDELASIAVASARTYRSLTGEEPYVAMLSYSTKGSAQHADVDKVIEATAAARRMAPQLKIDGELQADAAIVPEVAKRKAPGSQVAGRANVLVFPNLDAANIGYKLVERLAGARAFGPLLQGLAKPSSDLSRGCTADDIINTIAMTAAQKQ